MFDNHGTPVPKSVEREEFWVLSRWKGVISGAI